MSEEKELIKKRGSFKGRLTYFINYLDTLNDKELNNCDATELQLRIGKIESLYEQYDEVQLRLECIVDDIKTQYSERSEFESLYYKSLSKSQNLLSKFNKDNQSIISDKSIRTVNHKPVKLPTIQLPKFNGSYGHWLEFRDTFLSLIHSNNEMDEINKFHYLRASLEGSAAVVIQSVEFSTSNYLVAWNLICERFDNKRLLIQNHVSALFSIEAITRESSVALKGLIDQLNKNLRSLESLGEPVAHWDTLIIYIVTRKLDPKTYREWEEYKGNFDKDRRITLDNFIHFIRTRADLIETLELSRHNTAAISKSGLKVKSMVTIQDPSNSSNKELHSNICPKCKNDHYLNNCPQFLAMSNESRLKLINNYKICFNCFRSGHYANQCKKPGCKLCKRRYNTLVHVEFRNASVASRNDKINNDSASADRLAPSLCSASACPDTTVALSAKLSAAQVSIQRRGVLLSTALIKLYDSNNREYVVRAILDSGSTSCFMSRKICKLLQLPTIQIGESILGINNVSLHVGETCQVKMTSLDNSFVAKINCFVLPLITTEVPCHRIDISSLNIPSNICLADPTFYEPSDIDMLMGADIFWDLLGSQKLKLGVGMPVLCETRLGWIVSGPVSFNCIKFHSNDKRCNFATVSHCTDNTLDNIRTDLTRFWNLEEVNLLVSHYTPEEKLCEEHFIKNTARLDSGRFCVRIPLKQSPTILGNSINRATQCLYSLERRLKAKPVISKLYHDFMFEYESLNHMNKCKEHTSNPSGYYIPHHGVLRESSTTTKLRVVFNASCPTTSGISSNDIQMVGPTVQDDVLSKLLRFRQHRYVLSADVEKMYRQIVVCPSDRYLQKILWRNNVCSPITEYTLNTVTYGTASAPFLATRCIKQLGLECKDNKIADIILHDFYVDDLLTGGDSLKEVQFIRESVTKVLASACMPLRKWKSNETKLVSDSNDADLNLNMEYGESDKLLGLNWYSKSDELGFSIDSTSLNGSTKRHLLSSIARIYDPLGLLSPIVITMKMLLQKIWLDKLSWDQPLSHELHNNWRSICQSLHILNEFRIPRNVICNSFRELEIHVFSDASERAFGACAYVHSINDEGDYFSRLLMAKSRVSPLKLTTIPRLELCGAVVEARIVEKVISSLRVKINRVYCWTDSTIVLGWLQMASSRLQPFVRNRVAEILDKTHNCTWRHVQTDKNPADLISRGVDISKLQNLSLWWHGPDFLNCDKSLWPSQSNIFNLDALPETRTQVSLNAVRCDNNNTILDFTRFSNYSRLVRAVAYTLRFIRLCKGDRLIQNFLSHDELQNSLNMIIRISQSESFSEYKLLINKQSFPKKSPLLKYNVYLDENAIMRVGGRLNNSNFSYNKKHPIILQSTHKFTKLLFDYEHKRLMHAGPQLLLATIRESYWPLGGRNIAKACYHKCIRCHRMKGKVITPLMGNLPQQRLLPGFPFESTGVDYAGPIMCASRQGRGCRLIKTYIAIFICFTTKAVHLELVGDLTSNKYLLALYRFISRRGKPVNIYSDNGTSFVGAYNELSKFLKTNCDTISEKVANDGIKFNFIPAYTPHFGGLWEAGVKSTKYHLQRVLGNCKMTFEELNTTLVQIEAVLNSRPLKPLSSDSSDYTPLTPGHFLVGRPLTAIPQADLKKSSISQLNRFQRIEQLRQHFWQRWSKEFIAELQHRTKWRHCKDGLKMGSLVVIKDENLPPLKWKLGRIVAVYPGSDGIARVSDIQTSSGIVRRAFNRICPLPISESS